MKGKHFRRTIYNFIKNLIQVPSVQCTREENLSQENYMCRCVSVCGGSHVDRVKSESNDQVSGQQYFWPQNIFFLLSLYYFSIMTEANKFLIELSP